MNKTNRIMIRATLIVIAIIALAAVFSPPSHACLPDHGGSACR